MLRDPIPDMPGYSIRHWIAQLSIIGTGCEKMSLYTCISKMWYFTID